MLPMSTSSSTSTPTRDSRRRKPQSQPRKLVRNSSLFGSIKNFVAAPFSRFFTGSSEEFDDEKDLSGKRRRYQNGSQNFDEAYEDGPAPAKRLRISSPSLSPPPGNRGGYLDPPSSAFKQNNSSSIYNPPSRSASINIPYTTISDSNTRSTISPLRRQLSSGMTIDSHPTSTTYPRSISRDTSMAAIPNVGTAQQDAVFQRTERLPSRDHSMPPLSGRPSFIMRSSMTPQPQRDVSEPPPMTSLNSYPVFVRGPSQARETQQKPTTTTTLGSLVDSQRNSAPSSHQRHSTLFGRPGQNDPQSAMAEKVLHELDFYKTPLVPTRLRKAPRGINAPSDITDMFSRKHSLVLMEDDNRNGRLGKRGSRKEKTREDNASKPYAGTTGLKKRLAKHKQEAASESRDAEEENEEVPSAKSQVSISTKVASQAVPTPTPPPPGTDWFSLASSSAVSSSSPQASSLRVGRASRPHLSRPARPNKSTTKFSAAFDDDEEISEDSKKELAELEEAAKKVPAFDIPAGFTFAKDDKPVEPDSTIGKEPPITSLPFSLFQSPTPTPPTKPKDLETTSQSSVTSPSSSNATTMVSDDRTETRFEPPLHSNPEDAPATSVTSVSHMEGKVPNFFAGSKLLSAQNPPAPVFGIAPDNKQSGAESVTSSSSATSSPFSFNTSPSSGLVTASVPVKESDGLVWQGEKGTDNQIKSSSGAPSPFSFPSRPESALMPSVDIPKKEQSVPVSGGIPAEFVPFSFAKSNDTAKPSLALPFSFGPSNTGTSSEQSTGSLAFGSGTKSSLFEANSETGGGNTRFSSPMLFPSTSEPANKADKPTSSFGEPKSHGSAELSKPFLFGQPQKSDVPSNSTVFESNVSDKPVPGFSFGQPNPTASSASTGTAAFTFGNGGSVPSPIATPKTFFGFGSSGSSNDVNKPFPLGSTSSVEGVVVQPKPFSFGSAASTNSHNPFGDSKPTGFGFGSRPVTPPNQDHEVKMDESPTRDLQLSVRPAEPRSTLGGFSYNSAPSFGQQNKSQTSVDSTSSPFAFGSTSNGSNPFGGMKNGESKGFSFVQTQGVSSRSSISSPFNFGNKQVENDPPRPSTAGSFSFGSPATTTPTASFSFGTSNTSVSNSNLFGQTSGSAPSSPSTFGQPTPSSFGGGQSVNPFMFGSQPASPATPSSSLPPSGFGPTSGFGGTQPQSSGSNGTLFTIGSAPTAMGANTQGRQIKRLPKRGGKR